MFYTGSTIDNISPVILCWKKINPCLCISVKTVVRSLPSWKNYIVKPVINTSVQHVQCVIVTMK